jgi:cold shock CspA family protein/ribosome-associated translation inhibitor RaiA
MRVPPQIAFHNMPRSEPIEATVREKLAKLESFCDQVMGCRVVVEVPHRHHHYGNMYQVRIDLTVPGEEIVVNREASEHTAYRDLNVALRDSFDAARRQLEDYVRRRRGLVKAHEAPPHARVIRLYPEEGYGFLGAPDGREVYFHRNGVLHDRFKDLEVGTEVTFVEEPGEKGPQASTVRVVGRHGHLATPPA